MVYGFTDSAVVKQDMWKVNMKVCWKTANQNMNQPYKRVESAYRQPLTQDDELVRSTQAKCKEMSNCWTIDNLFSADASKKF